MIERRVVIGVVWGLDERRILTATALSEDGVPLDEFYLRVGEENQFAQRMHLFIGKWGGERMIVEDLASVEDVKGRVDGPLAVSSPSWKRKMKCCRGIQPEIQGMGVDVVTVKSTVETYTRCACCGELLTKDVRMGRRQQSP